MTKILIYIIIVYRNYIWIILIIRFCEIYHQMLISYVCNTLF